MTPKTMRAAVITRFGGPEVLEVQERPVPTPSANEILVRVHGSALNRADLHQREGNYPAPKGAPADIPGLEFAGEVAAAGVSVTNCNVGDRVFGIVPGGGNAQYLTTDARAVAPIPSSLDLSGSEFQGLSDFTLRFYVWTPSSSGNSVDWSDVTLLTASPEPGTIAMLFGGLAGIAAIARRRRSRQ